MHRKDKLRIVNNSSVAKKENCTVVCETKGNLYIAP